MERLERILKRSDAETNYRVLIIRQIKEEKYISVNKTKYVKIPMWKISIEYLSSKPQDYLNTNFWCWIASRIYFKI